MTRFQSFLSSVVVTFVTFGSAFPTDSSPHVVHERRYTSSGLQRGQRVDQAAVATFRIGLKQSNLERANEYVMNVSDPASPQYGKLWTSESVRETFSPSKDSVATVYAWLSDSGIEHIIEKDGWLSFESNVGYVERMLKATYHEHYDLDTGRVRIGCDE